MSQVEFAGQVALVTGASRGIGASIAAELARQGLKVIAGAGGPCRLPRCEA
jgi:3-oxoacyl-[acyl-carrier protein] reductase